MVWDFEVSYRQYCTCENHSDVTPFVGELITKNMENSTSQNIAKLLWFIIKTKACKSKFLCILRTYGKVLLNYYPKKIYGSVPKRDTML